MWTHFHIEYFFRVSIRWYVTSAKQCKCLKAFLLCILAWMLVKMSPWHQRSFDFGLSVHRTSLLKFCWCCKADTTVTPTPSTVIPSLEKRLETSISIIREKTYFICMYMYIYVHYLSLKGKRNIWKKSSFVFLLFFVFLSELTAFYLLTSLRCT